ncbi:MAG: hydroxylamine oxidation protein HaoB [Methylohalobius sp. ZOD2]|nr:hydroxylamine oxidation protein HaoB [Methylothermaceae bacterium]
MKRRYLVGGALLLAGAALLVSTFWPQSESWEEKRVSLSIPESLSGHYSPTEFERWELYQSDTGKRLTLHVARYRDEAGTPRQVLLPEPESRQWQSWMALGEFLRSKVEPNALVLAWWDDSQRIDFFSGRRTWVLQPPTEAFGPTERDLWRRLSGGFGDAEGKLAQLARWFTQDPEQALAEIAQLEPDAPLYLLVANGDLSHVNEIERLAGKKLPLEVKIFPSTENLHGQIASVQRWAGEKGAGYLPQKVPGGIAAWRIARDPENTDEDNEPLLVRLLPFTTSLENPLSGLERVHQSSDGYLTLYRRR